MPQTSNVLSFVPVANTEHGQRRFGAPAPRPPGVEDDAVLRKIAEAALSATGADGAALALRREGEVVCVARAGEMAPPLEARLSDSSGVSGECFREGQALRCDDTETDSRVDAEACRSLGLRSLAVAAVHQGGEVVGILEVFSEKTSTFTDRHLEVLRQLAELVIVEAESESAVVESPGAGKSSTEVVADSPQPRLLQANAAEELPVKAALAEAVPVEVIAAPVPLISAATPLPADVNIAAYMAAHEKAKAQPLRIPNIVLVGLAVVTVSAFVGWYLGHRKSETVPAAAVQTAAPGAAPVGLTPNLSSASMTTASPDTGSKPSAGVSPDDGSEGKGKNAGGSVKNAASKDRIASNKVSSTKAEHIVPPPAAATVDTDVDTAPALPASSGSAKPTETFNTLLNTPTSLPSRAPPISQGVEGGELQTQVGAIYPPQARAAGQHGTVVLELLVAPNGSVKDVKVVSGPPMLRQAAMDAVRRWKYSPFKLNGKPISAQTQVQIDFKLQ